MQEFIIKPIGTIYSPYKEVNGMPVQPKGSNGAIGKIEINPELTEGLKDLQDFSHVILIYQFHGIKEYSLEVTSLLDNKPHGIFSTRAPKRPNPIGISIVELIDIKDNILNIKNIDVLDGTPLLDIKPYISEFDSYTETKIGWMENVAKNAEIIKSDNRFIK